MVQSRPNCSLKFRAIDTVAAHRAVGGCKYGSEKRRRPWPADSRCFLDLASSPYNPTCKPPLELWILGYLEEGIQTPMAEGRSTNIISKIKRIRTSGLLIQNSVSLRPTREQEVVSAEVRWARNTDDILYFPNNLDCRGQVEKLTLFRGVSVKSETTFVNQLSILFHKCGLRCH